MSHRRYTGEFQTRTHWCQCCHLHQKVYGKLVLGKANNSWPWLETMYQMVTTAVGMKHHKFFASACIVPAFFGSNADLKKNLYQRKSESAIAWLLLWPSRPPYKNRNPTQYKNYIRLFGASNWCVWLSSTRWLHTAWFKFDKSFQTFQVVSQCSPFPISISSSLVIFFVVLLFFLKTK